VSDFLSLPTFAGPRGVHAVVETPRHAQAKFKYEQSLGVFVLSRALPLGPSYPYDWGFVPSTIAPDGDPLDVLVLHNVTTSPSVVLRCQPIGIFFTAAVAGTGKRLKFLGWRGPRAALTSVRRAQKAFDR
jgi:inorganic pyrophosphatase